MADAFRTVIIPISGRVNAKTISAAYDKVGPEMFPTFLSASGAEPATHVISSGLIPDGFTDFLPYSTWVWNGTQWLQTIVSAGDAAAIRTYVNSKGYNFSIAQINTFLASLDISDQPPFEAMDRLGLKIINPPVI